VDLHAESWTGDYAETFVVLEAGTDLKRFAERISDYLKQKYPSREPATLFLQQYSRRYLHGRYEDGVQVGGRIAYVRLFSIIAAFILLSACINFMNLSTAQASRKTKEIGVKKAIGAQRKALIGQFLGESMLTVLFSLIIAVLWVLILLAPFNELTGKSTN
jgi:ABC-type antimicrobial peptide transport system permease subunit